MNEVKLNFTRVNVINQDIAVLNYVGVRGAGRGNIPNPEPDAVLLWGNGETVLWGDGTNVLTEQE